MQDLLVFSSIPIHVIETEVSIIHGNISNFRWLNCHNLDAYCDLFAMTYVDEPSKGLKIQGQRVKNRSFTEDFWSTSSGDIGNSAFPSHRSISSSLNSKAKHVYSPFSVLKGFFFGIKQGSSGLEIKDLKSIYNHMNPN
ncbi:UNVERIFIED_CONTAM: hypothetical protein Sangu_1606200 [Sesamum angustifolium]|uniref:Uncharacterized protein n=1 Tax=Sesamum angustifolium TaxID=2727405 RepID=A0AAW2MH36_9LAMI